MSTRVVPVEERRARLARRHCLSPAHRAPDVVAAADAMVALHATDQPTIYLAARARVEGLERADVDRSLYEDRSLIKQLCMRRTLFVVSRSVLPTVVAAASRRVGDQEHRRLVKDVESTGLVPDGERWLADVSEVVLAELDRCGEATSSELRAALPVLDVSMDFAPDKSYGGTIPLAPRVLTVLSAQGRVVRASNRARWVTSRPSWARAETWLGEPIAEIPVREAMADLVDRWLHAFGPGTVEDIRWWAGSTKTAVRAALADVRAVEVDLGGAVGYLAADDLDPVAPVEPWGALLPVLDPTTMGWKERDWYLGGHAPMVFDSFGNGGPTAWWNGRVVGGWVQDAEGSVALQLLEDIGADGHAALEARATELTAWLDGVRPSPMFTSPLSATWTSG